MKKAVLFLNGRPPVRALIDRAFADPTVALVFCTDGAYKYLLPHLPDAVVGDFDSVARTSIKAGIELIQFSREKDCTDGFLAMRILIERGYKEIDVYGAYGGRPDMQESNYLLLALAQNCGVRARLCGTQNTYLVTDRFSCKLPLGARLSLVPFTDKAHIVYTKGLKYPLSDYALSRFDAVDSPDFIMGTSNQATEEEVEVAVGRGAVLVFVEEGGAQQ